MSEGRRHYSDSSEDSGHSSRSHSRSHYHSTHRRKRHDYNDSRSGFSDKNRDEFGRDGPAREKRAPEAPHKRKQSTSSDSGLDADSDTFAFDMSEAVPHHRRTAASAETVLSSIKTPSIYSIHRGVVKRVLDFGSFVRISAFSFDGLVYPNQYPLDMPPPKEGKEVYVKVLKVFEKDGKPKMMLSLKECNQSTGGDLNPSNQHDEGCFADNDGIQVGAIRKAVCSRCGMPGHMEWECYVDLGQKELFTLVSSSDSEKERKEKKEKHHHHHHRHHHSH